MTLRLSVRSIRHLLAAASLSSSPGWAHPGKGLILKSSLGFRLGAVVQQSVLGVRTGSRVCLFGQYEASPQEQRLAKILGHP